MEALNFFFPSSSALSKTVTCFSDWTVSYCFFLVPLNHHHQENPETLGATCSMQDVLWMSMESFCISETIYRSKRLHVIWGNIWRCSVLCWVFSMVFGKKVTVYLNISLKYFNALDRNCRFHVLWNDWQIKHSFLLSVFFPSHFHIERQLLYWFLIWKERQSDLWELETIWTFLNTLKTIKPDPFPPELM